MMYTKVRHWNIHVQTEQNHLFSLWRDSTWSERQTDSLISCSMKPVVWCCYDTSGGKRSKVRGQGGSEDSFLHPETWFENVCLQCLHNRCLHVGVALVLRFGSADRDDLQVRDKLGFSPFVGGETWSHRKWMNPFQTWLRIWWWVCHPSAVVRPYSPVGRAAALTPHRCRWRRLRQQQPQELNQTIDQRRQLIGSWWPHAGQWRLLEVEDDQW